MFLLLASTSQDFCQQIISNAWEHLVNHWPVLSPSSQNMCTVHTYEYIKYLQAFFKFVYLYGASIKCIKIYSPLLLHIYRPNLHILSYVKAVKQKSECHRVTKCTVKTWAIINSLLSRYLHISYQKQDKTVFNILSVTKKQIVDFKNQCNLTVHTFNLISSYILITYPSQVEVF